MSYNSNKMIRSNSNHSTISLYKKAIINSFFYKKANELHHELTQTKKIIWKLRENKQKLIDELHAANRTIDTMEMLNKQEAALRQDIRTLVQKKRQLQLDIYKLKLGKGILEKK